MVFYNDILFTSNECSDIKNLVTDWKPAGFDIKDNNGVRKIYNFSKRKSLVSELYFDKTHFVYNKINSIVQTIGYELVCESFLASILKYELGSFLYRHHDRDGDRFLCISSQLSDSTNYNGGDFLYFLNNEPIKGNRQIGNTIMFNPDLTHEVTTLESGERQCMIIWLNLSQLTKLKKNSII